MGRKLSILDKLLGKNKLEHEAEPIPFEPQQVLKEPEVEDFMEIGGSPAPGITLRQVLPGPISSISSSAWSPDGKYLAIQTETFQLGIWDPIEFGVRIWNVTSGDEIFLPVKRETKFMLTKDDDYFHSIPSIAWSPDGKYLAACYYFWQDSYPRIPDEGSSIYIWNTEDWHISLQTEPQLNFWGGKFVWAPDASTLAVCSRTEGLVFIDPKNGEIKDKLFTGKHTQHAVWSPDGNRILLRLENKNRIYNLSAKHIEPGFGQPDVQDGLFSWHPNGHTLASSANEISSWDKLTYDVSPTTIRIWNIDKGMLQRELEGHTMYIMDFCFYSGGELLISASKNEIRLWHTDSWESVAINNLESVIGRQIALHPQLPIFASSGKNNTVRIWKSDYVQTLEGMSSQSVQYTTAKIVLVGDSGVGKTGLGWRLAHDEFKDHASTHGQQFWIAPALSAQREDGTECESVLWDLAGQHVYRSIHSIFLDNVDTSIILFDPTNRQDSLKGARFWLEQLKGNKQLPPSVLVGARIDRGASVLSQEDLDQFCQEYGISGGYIGTSAKSGEGIDQLIETIRKQIPWEGMIATVTTTTFKRIKEFVLSLKEKPDRKSVLVKPDDLKKLLSATDQDWKFSDAEMMTAVGHLAKHGYISILRNSAGEEYILLAVDLLAYLASSIILLADKHPKELGAVSETDLLQGKYQFEELKGLDQKEQGILIDAAVFRFLEHKICFRETTESDILLVFPTLIKQKKPLDNQLQVINGISYIVRGTVENLYARIAVLVGYTPSYTRVNQWQNHSQFVTSEGKICGFRLIEDHEGEIELVLYYGVNTPERERIDFQVLFERFLYQHKVEVIPFPSVVCPKGHPQERSTVVNRLRRDKKFMFCDECGAQTELPVPTEQKVFDAELPEWLQREEAMAQLRSFYEVQIANVKSYRRDWGMPRCYISFVKEQNEFVEVLKHDLAEAGILIINDPANVEENDYILIINSSPYEDALEKRILADDRNLITSRAKNSHKGIITLKQQEKIRKHDMSHCEPDSFSDETHHIVNVFDLVLHLYAIPLDHAGFKQLRQKLHQQWEQTLAREPYMGNAEHTKEVFISYSWRDESEKIANELDDVFQKRGITIVRDKRELGFRGRIKSFMETIGKGKAVILVINEKYLKSENCLFELLQIAKQGDFEERIFPIVLEDSRIYKPVERIRYVQFWEQQLKELDDAMKTVSAANMDGFREDIDLYAEIRANLPRLSNILKDMNALTPSIHRDEDFQQLFDAVMKKLEE